MKLQKNRLLTYEDHILFGKRILLAEDNRVNAEVVMKFLHLKGIQSELAHDGQETVEMFRSRGPSYYQAVLMDLMMPRKSGLEAAKEIRRLPQPDAGSIPILALTADVANDMEARIQEAGMQGFITKPIEAAVLYSRLTQAFENKASKLHTGPDGESRPEGGEE